MEILVHTWDGEPCDEAPEEFEDGRCAHGVKARFVWADAVNAA